MTEDKYGKQLVLGQQLIRDQLGIIHIVFYEYTNIDIMALLYIVFPLIRHRQTCSQYVTGWCDIHQTLL